MLLILYLFLLKVGVGAIFYINRVCKLTMHTSTADDALHVVGDNSKVFTKYLRFCFVINRIMKRGMDSKS